MIEGGNFIKTNFKNQKDKIAIITSCTIILFTTLCVILSINPLSKQSTDETSIYIPETVGVDVDEYTGAKYVNNQVIITLENNVSSEEIQNICEKYNVTIADKINDTNLYCLQTEQPMTRDEIDILCEDLRYEPNIKDASFNTIIYMNESANQITERGNEDEAEK